MPTSDNSTIFLHRKLQLHISESGNISSKHHIAIFLAVKNTLFLHRNCVIFTLPSVVHIPGTRATRLLFVAESSLHQVDAAAVGI